MKNYYCWDGLSKQSEMRILFSDARQANRSTMPPGASWRIDLRNDFDECEYEFEFSNPSSTNPGQRDFATYYFTSKSEPNRHFTTVNVFNRRDINIVLTKGSLESIGPGWQDALARAFIKGIMSDPPPSKKKHDCFTGPDGYIHCAPGSVP
jgi:hypothetical protein